MTKSRKLIVVRHVENPVYRKELLRARRFGICPFHSPEFQKKPVIVSWGGWYAVECTYPAKDEEGGHVKNHFLILPRIHKEVVQPKDWMAVGRVFTALCRIKRIAGGAICLRFGDGRWNGRSIYHAHFHVIQPRLGRNRRAIKHFFFVG